MRLASFLVLVAQEAPSSTAHDAGCEELDRQYGCKLDLELQERRDEFCERLQLTGVQCGPAMERHREERRVSFEDEMLAEEGGVPVRLRRTIRSLEADVDRSMGDCPGCGRAPDVRDVSWTGRTFELERRADGGWDVRQIGGEPAPGDFEPALARDPSLLRLDRAPETDDDVEEALSRLLVEVWNALNWGDLRSLSVTAASRPSTGESDRVTRCDLGFRRFEAWQETEGSREWNIRCQAVIDVRRVQEKSLTLMGYVIRDDTVKADVHVDLELDGSLASSESGLTIASWSLAGGVRIVEDWQDLERIPEYPLGGREVWSGAIELTGSIE